MTSADTRGSTLIILAVLLLALLLSGLSFFLLRPRAGEELEGDLAGLEGGRTDTADLQTVSTVVFIAELERTKEN